MNQSNRVKIMRYKETKGEWGCGFPVKVCGIMDANEKCVAVKVIDLTASQVISWTFNDKQRAQFSRILESV